MPSEIISRPDKYGGRRDSSHPIDPCPNCGRQASAVGRSDQRVIWPKVTENLAPPLTPYVLEEVWICIHCDRSLTLLKIYGEGDNQTRDPERVVMVWPELSPRELPAEAPQAVADLYREASVAENAGALRGAAGLYRAAVEELVKDRGAVGASLNQKIGSLNGMGVTADLVEDLHEARLLGNWSLHDGVVFAAEEVADVAKLIEEAVEELYVQPARRLQMQRARAGRRQALGQTPP